MSHDWNDLAAGWDDSADVRLYAEKAFASLAAHVDLDDPAWRTRRVLDFGCGTGLLAEKIAPHVREVVAVDTSERMIAVLAAKGRPNLRAVHADILSGAAGQAGIAPGGFDLVCASSVCGFLPDYEGAVETLAGLLGPGGRFVQWDWRATDGDDFGLTPERMTAALKAAGLRAVRVEEGFGLEAGGAEMPVLTGTGTRP